MYDTYNIALQLKGVLKRKIPCLFEYSRMLRSSQTHPIQQDVQECLTHSHGRNALLEMKSKFG